MEAHGLAVVDDADSAVLLYSYLNPSRVALRLMLHCVPQELVVYLEDSRHVLYRLSNHFTLLQYPHFLLSLVIEADVLQRAEQDVLLLDTLLGIHKNSATGSE